MRGFTSESSNGGLISGSFAQTFIISANNGGNGISGLFFYIPEHVWLRKINIKLYDKGKVMFGLFSNIRTIDDTRMLPLVPVLLYNPRRRGVMQFLIESWYTLRAATLKISKRLKHSLRKKKTYCSFKTVIL